MREAGLQPDVIAYTTAIKICVDTKNLKTAFSLFAEMKRYQVKPNMVTYNTLLRARTRYGSLQEVQQCLGVYQDMRKAGYKPNDYYLKQLIEEWCEGVIQNNNQNGSQVDYCNNTETGGPPSLLLEKVAAHLQKKNTESVAIDVQGLTKVEARIVVLAVLQMIKENNAQGLQIKDDLWIILGAQTAGATSTAEHKHDVEGAMIKLLKDELGLEVIFTGSKNAKLEIPADSYTNVEKTQGNNKFLTESMSPTRRPVVLQRLKVTRKSLECWLQRRVAAKR